MKTLADFKREVEVGMKVQCNGVEESKILETWAGGNLSDAPRGPLQVVPLAERMAGVRTVTYKDTTGFYLNATPEDGKRGSFCGFPKAGDLEYTGGTFTITERTHKGEPWQRRHYTLVK